MGYRHLSIVERSHIAVYRTLQWSTRQIAAQLGRHHATIAREYRRGCSEETYHATQAHQHAIARRAASRPQGRYTATLATHISALLHKTWSPEQIAAFHRINAIPSVSYATIYRWMYAGRMPQVSVRQLRHKGKRRAPVERRGRFSSGQSIHMRPREVHTRRTFGHWEADTVVSGRGKSRACMATFVERYSRWYVAIPMADRTAQAMHDAIRTLVHRLPRGACNTLTVDRGKEFAAHQAYAMNYTCPSISLMRMRHGNVVQTRIVTGYSASFSPKGQTLRRCQRTRSQPHSWQSINVHGSVCTGVLRNQCFSMRCRT